MGDELTEEDMELLIEVFSEWARENPGATVIIDGVEYSASQLLTAMIGRTELGIRFAQKLKSGLLDFFEAPSQSSVYDSIAAKAITQRSMLLAFLYPQGLTYTNEQVADEIASRSDFGKNYVKTLMKAGMSRVISS